MNRLEDRDYRRFRELIAARTGLDFPEQRRGDLEAGLRKGLGGSPCEDLHSYYVLLANEARGRGEFDQLVMHLTVGETHFFRNSAQFAALRQEILPQLIARHQASRRLRIWSAGCAAGEEPYSLAIVLRELLPAIDAWTILILGTDINKELLRRARRARYGPWSFRTCPPATQDRYFVPQGAEFELRAEIRPMVTFVRHNLVADSCLPPAAGTDPMDLILCRNVTIYFDGRTTQQVVDHFYDYLADDGWLIVGHAEPSLEVYRRFLVRNFPDAIAYQKALPEQPPPVADAEPVLHEPLPSPDPFGKRTSLGDPTVPSTPVIEAGLGVPPHTAEDIYRQAREHADGGRLQEALRLIEESLATDPLQPRAHHLVGLIWQEQGQWERALESFRRATFLDPTFILAYVALADVARRTGNVEQARRALQTAGRLLQEKPRGELVPEAEGLTVGRLLDAVALQLQAG